MAPDLSQIDVDPMLFLIAPTSMSKFFKDSWERRPEVFKSTPPRKLLLSSLFGLRELQAAAEASAAHGEPLQFGLDINAARYVNSERETANKEVTDPASLLQLFQEEGCTLQVHQPQRFDDALWRLCAALEAQLGCLVGCNAYITPAGKQGLAPHYDDVEIFVLQTKGRKKWKVYVPGEGPHAGCALANQPSGDLLEADLGKPFIEVTLEVGDVLYLPRGTGHQAMAVGKGHSSHLTISTYQCWAWADLAQYATSVALVDPGMQRRLPAVAKAGLPVGFLYQAAFGAADAAALAVGGGARPPGTDKAKAKAGAAVRSGEDPKPALARQLAAVFRGLAEYLDESATGGVVVGAAADALAEDFMRSRLPPHPAQVPAAGPPPGEEDSVLCRGVRLFRLVPLMDGPGGGGCSDSDCEEDHDHDHHHSHSHSHGGSSGDGVAEGPSFVRLVSCVCNDRASHMLGDGSGSGDSDSDSDSDSESESGSELEWVADADLVAARLKRKRGAEQQAAGSEEESEEEVRESEAAEDEFLAGEEEVVAQEGEESELKKESEEEGEDDSEDEEKEQEDLVFPASFAPALLQVLGEGAGAVRVADLELPLPELRIQVAQALWQAGVVATVPPPQPKETAAKEGQKGRAGGKGSAKGGKRARCSK